MNFPVIKRVSYALAHVPNLVRYGSKPERELRKDPALAESLRGHLRTFEQARDYPPNQVFLGNLSPGALWEIDQPWWNRVNGTSPRVGPYGEIMPELEFYGLLRFADEFELINLEAGFLARSRSLLESHPLIQPEDLKRLGNGLPSESIERKITREGAIPLYDQTSVVGCVCRGHEEDPFLSPEIMLENLACKASGILATRWLLYPGNHEAIDPQSIGYVLNSGEEAVGDRYQRGAGNLAKAIAERCGCARSTGGDIKAFCCGPIHAIVIGSSLVQSGVFENVLVVGGGALGKLGMKFRGHLAHDMPILEDVLASFAILIGPHDSTNPVIRLDAIGRHEIRFSGSAQGIAEALISTPLNKLGWKITDVDRFSVELHNPEVTEPSGSGNVPRYNYRTIASLGVMRKEWAREAIGDFERIHGLPGFSPTQGHVPSAIPYLGHARDAMQRGEMKSAMFIGKGSLFLGKMTNLSDGMSFILEAAGYSGGKDGITS